MDFSIDDPDIDITKVKNTGEFNFFNKEKGYIQLIYYYEAADAAYKLKTYKKNKFGGRGKILGVEEKNWG